MFKIGDVVSKDDVFAAGWMFESFSAGMTDVVFVDEDNAMCVMFEGNSNTGAIQEYVCKEMI